MNSQSNKSKHFNKKNKKSFTKNSQSKAPEKKYRKGTYHVIFFENFPAARSSVETILKACENCDQLNVVIRAEGNMDDPKLLGIDNKVKVFAGAAWTTIHERRQEEGWYNIPQNI